MKYIRYAMLLLLLLLVMSACGIAVLWIMGKIFSVTFDNLIYSGFRIGLIASILLIISNQIKKKKEQ